ncbi:hypothetical protein D3877_29240 [Azospirillum cavernae]|uniref:Uncharacterized protein n=1 Tax=Azospirillum cavernae TaxID=2320860 RepID=A0A418VK10_9PROT|nr:hypothetical protein [Azospirillum cavernae]RJF76472.1 hypothetical protein D3877_29240 [Azospirillum cavernae]
MSAAVQIIDGRMSAGIRIAVDPALRNLAHRTCTREGIELSDVVRDAIVAFLKGKGVEVNYAPRRPGRPRKAQTEV